MSFKSPTVTGFYLKRAAPPGFPIETYGEQVRYNYKYISLNVWFISDNHISHTSDNARPVQDEMSSRTPREATPILADQVGDPSLRLHPLAAAPAPPVAGDSPVVENVHLNALLLPNWCYLYTTSNCAGGEDELNLMGRAYRAIPPWPANRLITPCQRRSDSLCQSREEHASELSGGA